MKKREVYSDKIMILGVDGMDPRLTKKYITEGKMPNMKKLVEAGAQREDLVMLGSQPTVTPPQWTTLATGATPVVHGITQFNRTIPGRINQNGYNVDSRLSKAEPVWNCLVENGYKTLVLHWPGGAWPPTSDSENLYVIDGSAPGSVGSAAMQLYGEQMIGASTKFQEATFVNLRQSDAVSPCIIERMPEEKLQPQDTARGMQQLMQLDDDAVAKIQKMGIDTLNLVIEDHDGFGHRAGDHNRPVNTSISPIKDATGWTNAPEDAKEFVALFSDGLIRRVGLILKNESGIYDHVEIYKSKKDVTPLVTLYNDDKMVYNIVDDCILEDKKYMANRHFKLLDLAEDGTSLNIFASGVMDMNCGTVIHPKRIHEALLENVGPYPPQSSIYSQNATMQQAMVEVWDYVTEWYTKTIDYLIENEGIQMVFSHLHSIDFVEHTFIRHMHDIGFNEHPEEVYAFWMERLYKQVDDYIGTMLHYLDEGWTVIVTSDHAQVACEYIPPQAGDMCGVNVGLMKELGYTVLQKDENGKELRKIDWTKTRAIQSQGNDIFINLKGREPQGIVDPEDQYELEEQIMTDLYGYKHPDTGKRVIAMAIRNKDAILLGYGGPTAGDICIWIAEGYNYDHTDSLSTTYGCGETSSSPIFVAAGPGLKKSFTTDRIIRQVDLAPTISVLAGVRMPAQCEGAPIYQILEEEF